MVMVKEFCCKINSFLPTFVLSKQNTLGKPLNSTVTNGNAGIFVAAAVVLRLTRAD